MRSLSRHRKTTSRTRPEPLVRGPRPFFGSRSRGDDLVHLQQAVGNQAMQRLLQAGQDGLPSRGRAQGQNVPSAGARQGAFSAIRAVQRTSGRPLDAETLGFMESRFGSDFSEVRIHTDDRADAAAAAVEARAFTVGSDIALGQGQPTCSSPQGRRLLAHELVHAIQQGKAPPTWRSPRVPSKPSESNAPTPSGRGASSLITEGASAQQGHHISHVQRSTPAVAASDDPLCKQYLPIVVEVITEGLIEDLKTAPDIEKRLELVRELKWVRRCGTEAERSRAVAGLEAAFGRKEASAIWKEAGTPLGGYRGAYPGYYGGPKGRLKWLGVSETEAYGAFAFDTEADPAEAFLTAREAAATAEAATLTATDLLYFYGHHYSQYNAPGVFADVTQTQFIDLRALAGKGDFGRVKLILSTSCATCCKEAVETLSAIFPNAVILGYRRSSPKGGDSVRNDFDNGIRALKRPLLLEESVDVNAIIGVWKTVVQRRHPNERRRLPSYYKDGIVHYLEAGVWESMIATISRNSCKKKGDTLREAAH